MTEEREGRLNEVLGAASRAFSRNQEEEANVLGWLRRERDDTRSRLEISERRSTELADTLGRRESQLKEAHDELRQVKVAVRRFRLGCGPTSPQGMWQQVLLELVLRAWIFWLPRIDTSRKSRPGSDLDQALSPERTPASSWKHRPYSPERTPTSLWARPHSAASSHTAMLKQHVPGVMMQQARVPLAPRPFGPRPATAGTSRNSRCIVAEAPGSGSLVKQLAALAAVTGTEAGALASRA